MHFFHFSLYCSAWPVSVLFPSPLHSLPCSPRSTSLHRHLEFSRKEPPLLLAPCQFSVFLPCLFTQLHSCRSDHSSLVRLPVEEGPALLRAVPAPAASTPRHSPTRFHVLTSMLLTRSPSSSRVVCEPQESRSPAYPIVCCYVSAGHLVLCCSQSLSSLPVPTADVFCFPYSCPHPNSLPRCSLV